MKYFKLLFIALFFGSFSFAQIGVNADVIHSSAALDIQYGTNPKGLLIPRMTTTQRVAMSAPAESLMVFDTTEKAFYFYNTSTTSWMKMANEGAIKRNNYKLIKSAADLAAELAAGGSDSYLLQTNTYYEINGTVTLAKSINLNNAYVSGLDANEDVLSFPGGIVFAGNAGGSIKNVTLKGGQAFNITGPGITSNSSLLVQNTIVDGMTVSVGSISGLGLYFGGIVQFINNKDGIIYSNIGNLLLDNQAWLSSNTGTFEKFTGSFGLIEKGSGFSTVSGSSVALDVSTSGLSVGTGTLEGTVFSGTTTNTAGYIKGYSTGSYTGFNFNNAWTVDSPGIPRESDAVATGDINLDAVVGTGQVTTFSGTGTSSRTKLNGTTTSNSLFRFTKEANNRITYQGNKARYFQVSASVSYQGSAADMTLILYIAKNGSILPDTKVYGRPSSGFFSNSGILALPIVGTVQMKKGDYIEIWGERYDGSGNMSTISLNLTAR